MNQRGGWWHGQLSFPEHFIFQGTILCCLKHVLPCLKTVLILICIIKTHIHKLHRGVI